METQSIDQLFVREGGRKGLDSQKVKPMTKKQGSGPVEAVAHKMGGHNLHIANTRLTWKVFVRYFHI